MATFPVDPQYLASAAAINRRTDDQLSFLEQEQRAAGQEYGITDTSNPFSRAALLQRQYDQAQRSTTNSMAARGHLYSGALQSMRGENQFGLLRDQDRLRRDFSTLMGDIQRRRAEAQSGRQEGLIGAQDEALQRGIANRPDPESVLPPGDEQQSNSKAVSWAVWGRWTPAQRARYRARHRSEWDKYRPR